MSKDLNGCCPLGNDDKSEDPAQEQHLFPRLPGESGFSPARMCWVERLPIKGASVGSPRTFARCGSGASTQNRALLSPLPRRGCLQISGLVTEVRGWQQHFQTHFPLFSSETEALGYSSVGGVLHHYLGCSLYIYQ